MTIITRGISCERAARTVDKAVLLWEYNSDAVISLNCVVAPHLESHALGLRVDSGVTIRYIDALNLTIALLSLDLEATRKGLNSTARGASCGALKARFNAKIVGLRIFRVLPTCDGKSDYIHTALEVSCESARDGQLSIDIAIAQRAWAISVTALRTGITKANDTTVRNGDSNGHCDDNETFYGNRIIVPKLELVS